MLVLYWTSAVTTMAGRTLAMPIGVSDASLEAFCERLTRDGGALVTRLHLERRADGVSYITGEEQLFIGLAGTVSVRNHGWPVRREVDEVA